MDWLAVRGWKTYFRDKGKPWDDYLSAESYRNRHQLDGLTAIALVLAKRR